MDATTPVFVRIDGNIPHSEDVITDDFRLRRAMPTINALYQRGIPMILATHIDRPDAQYHAEHSSALIADWLLQQGYQAVHIPYDGDRSIEAYMKHVTPRSGVITVIENLRFFPGEKEYQQQFIDALSAPATFYVNDAWGMMHRTDSSVFHLPQAFRPTHRTYGHLVATEQEALSALRDDPESPYIIICGGAKIEKIHTIERIIEHKTIDTVVITPGIAGTFLYAQGYDVGASLCQPEYAEDARRIMDKAAENNIHLDVPTDLYIVPQTWDDDLVVSSVDDIPSSGIAIASGPKTLQRYNRYLSQAATVFLNGPMGDISHMHTIRPFQKLLQMIEQSPAYRVIGGGDSVAMVHTLAIDPFDFYSTGGGATLAYVSASELPALDIVT